MTPREKELVEAVRELIRVPFGLTAYMKNPPPCLLRAELKISNAMALYDDEPCPGRDITFENWVEENGSEVVWYNKGKPTL